ncbi:MAG: RidA family protein [Rhodobiaceae bacterium]|nr:RidA family protein [Rhodobiaceae bacterium]
MERVLYTTGWKSEREFAYSRAIRAGDFVFVSGTTGYDYARDEMPEDPAEQTEAALANIDRALRELGSDLSGLVQLTTYYTDDADWPAIGAVIGRVLADVRPTNSAVRTGLISPAMKIEISAMAVVDAPPKA